MKHNWVRDDDGEIEYLDDEWDLYVSCIDCEDQFSERITGILESECLGRAPLRIFAFPHMAGDTTLYNNLRVKILNDRYDDKQAEFEYAGWSAIRSWVLDQLDAEDQETWKAAGTPIQITPKSFTVMWNEDGREILA